MAGTLKRSGLDYDRQAHFDVYMQELLSDEPGSGVDKNSVIRRGRAVDAYKGELEQTFLDRSRELMTQA